MDASTSSFYAAASIPALVSTGITVLYFIIRLLNFLFDARTHQANAGKARPRVVHPNKTAAQKREEKAAWKFTQKYQNI